MEIISRQAKWSKMESNFKFIMKKLVSGLFQVFHFLREITGANQVGLWYAWSNASAAIFFCHVRSILKAKTKRSFESGWCVAHRNNLLSKLLWGICRRFHCSALTQSKLRAADWTDERKHRSLMTTPGSRKCTDSASLKCNPPLAYHGLSRRCPLSVQAGSREL